MTTASLDTLKGDRAALERVLREAGAKFTRSKTKCPFHKDHHPSGEIHEKNGVWRFHCHSAACGVSGDVIDMYRRVHGTDFKAACTALGVPLAGNGRSGNHGPAPKLPRKPAPVYQSVEAAADAAAKQVGGVVETIYTWGEHHSRVRIRLDGDKTYRPVSRNGAGWLIADPPKPFALYRLADLPADGTLYVVEGEKCCEAGRALGLPCTTSGGSSSAGNADWTPLAGRDVVILPDHHDAGHKYAEAVADRLAGLTPRPTIRILRLPDLGDGEDLVEFAGEYRDTLSADAIRAEIEALAAKTEPERPKPAPGSAVLLTMASIESAAIEWLWPGRIAMGSVTMLNAHPGAGKTTLMHDLAARVSSGVGWPDNPLQAQPVGGVVLLHCEDDLSRVVRPRLELARADLTRIIALRGVHTEDDTEGFFDLGRNLPALRQAIREAPDCRLVVIDPLGAFLGRADTHRHSETYNVLGPVADLAEREGVAVVFVSHLNKSMSPSAIGRQMGSVAFSGVSRNTWYVGKAPESQDPRERLLLHGKANLGPLQPGLRFRIESPGVVAWLEGAVELSADDVFRAEAQVGDTTSSERALVEAVTWLEDKLEAGPVLTRDLEEMAKAEGIAHRTLQRARGKVGVRAQQVRDDGKVTGWAAVLPPGHPRLRVAGES